MIPALLASALAAPPVPAAAPTTAAAPAEAPAPPAGPDRSHPPVVADPPVLPLAEPEVHELAPGVVARFMRVPGIRKVAIEVTANTGAVELGGPSALTDGMGWLADAAAGDLGPAQWQELEDLREIDVSSWVGQHRVGLSLTVPADELPKGLQMLGQDLRDPAWPKAEVKRWVLDRELFYTIEGPASQDALARAAMVFGWFPADHPYGRRPDLSQLKSVEAGALGALWTRATHEASLSVVAVGDVEWSALEPALKQMTAGLGKAAQKPTEAAFTPPAKPRAVIVDLPGQAQVAVRARWAAPDRFHADSPSVAVANFFLGGAFLSRLNLNLREEKGFTYGARSSYYAGRTLGHFSVTVDVKAVNLGATVTEIRKELHRIGAEPGTAEELVSARRGFAAEWNRTLSTAESALDAYDAAADRDLTMAEWRAEVEKLQAVELADVQAAAGRWFGDEAPVLWVFVGDAAAIREQLASSGLALEVVTPSDAILGRF